MSNKIKDSNPKESALILRILQDRVSSIDDIKSIFEKFDLPTPSVSVYKYNNECDEEDIEMGCTPTQYYEVLVGMTSYGEDRCFGKFQTEFEAYRYGAIRDLLGYEIETIN